MDEYPPAYLVSKADPAYKNGGKDSSGQLVRYIPNKQNSGAGSMWTGVCFKGPINAMSDRDFEIKVNGAPRLQKRIVRKGTLEIIKAPITVTQRPIFTITAWDHAGNPPPNDDLGQNPCWPSGIAAGDPGYALLTFDLYYGGQPPPYNYRAPYKKGTNGS